MGVAVPILIFCILVDLHDITPLNVHVGVKRILFGVFKQFSVLLERV